MPEQGNNQWLYQAYGEDTDVLDQVFLAGVYIQNFYPFAEEDVRVLMLEDDLDPSRLLEILTSVIDQCSAGIHSRQVNDSTSIKPGTEISRQQLKDVLSKLQSLGETPYETALSYKASRITRILNTLNNYKNNAARVWYRWY